jgi:hypothetical protein
MTWVRKRAAERFQPSFFVDAVSGYARMATDTVEAFRSRPVAFM